MTCTRLKQSFFMRRLGAQMACTQTPSAAAALKCVRGSLDEGLALPHFKAAAAEGI
jgi:hypothetical protein